MKKKVLLVDIILLVVIALCTFGLYKYISFSSQVIISKEEEDELIIPDKYNTGCEGQLEKLDGNNKTVEVQGVTFKNSGDNRILEFYYGPGITESATIRDVDFSDKVLLYYHPNMAANVDSIVLTFENCKFSSLKVNGIKTILKNCSMESIAASDCEMYNCKLGGTISDAIRAFNNVRIENCYITDISKKLITEGTPGAYHTDGVQLYGNQSSEKGVKGTLSGNIHFYNTRFEVPPLPFSQNAAAVNACIMIQLEFSDADDISFEKCYINGGGYSIYAHKCKLSEQITNILLKDIHVGKQRRYGIFYPDIDPNVEIDNVTETSSLYVASVWRDSDKKIHLSVTNDTNEDKVLVVYTENGREEFTIKAVPMKSWETDKVFFEDLPIDLDIKVNGSNFAVCFDNTYGDYDQIRYVNYTKDKVTLNLDESLFSNDVILEGPCGKNLTYKLYRNGIFEVLGTGAMENYHSGNIAPWRDNIDKIRGLKIEEGVTSIGNQAFGGVNMKAVYFPESLEHVGGRSFINSSLISELHFGKNLKTVAKDAFSFNLIKTVYYAGTKTEWIALDNGNVSELFKNSVIYYGKADEVEKVDEETMSDNTGKANNVEEGIGIKNDGQDVKTEVKEVSQENEEQIIEKANDNQIVNEIQKELEEELEKEKEEQKVELEMVLVGIKIKTEPSKKDFYRGETVVEADYSDIEVVALWSDNAEKQEERKLALNDFKINLKNVLSSVGKNKPVTVTYKNYTDSYRVNVNEREVKKSVAFMNGYADNTFRPNENIKRGEFAKIIATISQEYDASKKYVSSFKDKETFPNWAENYIAYVQSTKLMIGNNNKFNIDSYLTRGEAAKIICNMLSLDLGKKSKFKDVDGTWYAEYVAALENMDIIGGYSDNSFRGDNCITRAEICKIINKAFYSDKEISASEIKANLDNFKDVNKNAWYAKDVAKALNN